MIFLICNSNVSWQKDPLPSNALWEPLASLCIKVKVICSTIGLLPSTGGLLWSNALWIIIRRHTKYRLGNLKCHIRKYWVQIPNYRPHKFGDTLVTWYLLICLPGFLIMTFDAWMRSNVRKIMYMIVWSLSATTCTLHAYTYHGVMGFSDILQ